jgi:GTP cyclohydrolase I
LNSFLLAITICFLLFGKAHVAYLPNRPVVGISKLARLVEVFLRRLQIHERLTTHIADSLMSLIKPIGCGVVIEAKHFCMISRGVNKQNSIMAPSPLRGSFNEPDTK